MGRLLKLYRERAEAGLPTPTESLQVLKSWHNANDWAARARDYDMLLASRVANDVTDAMRSAREQRLRVAARLLEASEGMTDRLADMIRDIPTLVNIPPRDVAAIAKIALELSRAENAPEQAHILVDDEGVHVPVSTETVRELAQTLRASIEARVGGVPKQGDGDGRDRVQGDEDHGGGEGGGG
ncbi:MAG: hypothetical protein IPH08_03845 [Rhodocyclaceae bacterium]|nr:hypothetical protein [Rhodocyclaceae bacterium]